MGKALTDWVKKELSIRDISQRELARRAGVSHGLISNALRGTRPITLDFCKAVSDGLNKPIWEVLIMGGILDEIPKNLSESEDVRQLIRKYNSLSVENKADLQKYLDWLIIKQS